LEQPPDCTISAPPWGGGPIRLGGMVSVLLRYRGTSHDEYGPPERLSGGATFRLPAFPDVELDVDRFLPPAGISLAEKDR